MPDAIAPDGLEIYFRAVDGSRSSLVEVVLPAGAVSRPVRHRTVEEIWYFLSGEGEVWLRDLGGRASIRGVEPGDVVTIPTGWEFQFRTRGESPLRFLCFTTPSWSGPDEAVEAGDGGLGPPNVPT